MTDLATYYCHFCAKDAKDVQKLIAGPACFICDECIDLCHGILNDTPPAVAQRRDDLHATIVQTLITHAGKPVYDLADTIVDAIQPRDVRAELRAEYRDILE